MSKLDLFEDSLRNSMEGFEVPYNSSDWNKLTERMNKENGGGSSIGVYLGFIAGAMLLGGTLFYALSEENTLNEGALTEQITPSPIVDGAENTATVDDSKFTGSSSDLSEEKSGDELSEIVNDQDVDQTNSSSQITNTDVIPVHVPKKKTDAKSGSASKERSAIIEKNNPKDQPRLEAISTHNGAVTANSGQPSNSMGGFVASLNESCTGTNVTFHPEKVRKDVVYLWNFGDGSFSNKAETGHVYERAGSYEVMLSMTTTSGGQIQNEPIKDNIEIFDAPKAEFGFVPRSKLKKLPYVHFENTSRSAVRWEWNFGDGTRSNESHPDHVFKKSGTYQVTLSVVNERGCTDELTKSVVVTNDNLLKAPKTFSPNGDGVKDTFLPATLKEIDSPFKLSIYETTGSLLYTSYSTKNPWNGRIANGLGEIAPAGEYVWVVDFLDGEYKDRSFQGKTSLLN